MSQDKVEAATWIIAAVTYVVIGSANVGYNIAKTPQRCDHLEPGLARGKCYGTQAYKGLLSGVFWPIAIPAQIGAGIAGHAFLKPLEPADA